MPSKQVYPPFTDKGKTICSRCFGPLGDIEKYGCDDKGYWFIAPCKQCGAKMKWYRDKSGAPIAEAAPKDEESAFSFYMEGDEIIMKTE